ncbi:hypothetical protein NIES4071_87160 [Calothrix sp. NIES-4071]|nr:hypothetical protein NIES4071_87160 [Calothrix sp. NIES-4071]BAZ62983.1 hypothetical protein NIES4105_87090 [Calothrix sp. NIES-4105]
MEQWQFLIQKQGERAWQPLESGYAEIVEGRYRIVASSLNVNTDVEVRVIHQSPTEIPPRKRIYKRLRRTNSEGLTAVIPFTYFASGVWEVRCTSGDLMSDMFGTSWQHNLRLQVLPLIATTEITPVKSDTEGNLTKIENITSENTGLNLSSLDFADAELELQENYFDIPSNNQFRDSTVPSQEASTTNIDLVTEVSTENLLSNDINTLDNQNEQNTFVTETTSTIDTTDATDTIIDEPISLSTNSLVLFNNNEEVITDQPVNPVWVKGDTAEQILQNLIELALPGNDSLLEEEISTPSQLEQPLPLLLTLDEQSYVGQWGRALTVHGRVKLRDTTLSAALYKDDTSEFESVGNCELRLELRSPFGSEVLVRQQQSMGERLLPFGFEFSIQIPANCESKLILADIYLYGALSSVGDSILLASQSFIITADVAELLAVSATAKPSEPDMLELAQPQLTPEPEKSVSIDLELFNLVKTARRPLAPLVTQPSPKRALPLRVDAVSKAQTPQLSDERYTLELDSIVENSTSLPFLRKRQIPIEDETASNSEHLEQDSKELEIELPLLEPENLEPENLEPKDVASVIEENTVENTEYNQNDYIVTNNQYSNFAQPEEPQGRVTLPYNPRTSNNVPYVSPLIQKWMQSQGYSIPETTNFGYQYNNVEMAPPNVIIIGTQNSTDENINDDSNIQPDVGALETESVISGEPDIALEEVAVNQTTQEKTSSNWVAQEIVVDDIDDIDDSVENSTNNRDLELEALDKSVADMLSSLPISLEDIEILPVPQINLPAKELISGNTIRVRILLKEMRPNTGIKLWVEDCQTRWLLEGPHLLTDLQPNPFESGMEVMTELSIPFGCVEIRIEAVAVDIVTQLESDKVSIQRTVVPPDLPVLQFDEVLGI